MEGFDDLEGQTGGVGGGWPHLFWCGLGSSCLSLVHIMDSNSTCFSVAEEHGLLTEAEFAAKQAALASPGAVSPPLDKATRAPPLRLGTTLIPDPPTIPTPESTPPHPEPDSAPSPSPAPVPAIPLDAPAPPPIQLSADALRQLPRLPTHTNAGPGNSLVYRPRLATSKFLRVEGSNTSDQQVRREHTGCQSLKQTRNRQ